MQTIATSSGFVANATVSRACGRNTAEEGVTRRLGKAHLLHAEKTSGIRQICADTSMNAKRSPLSPRTIEPPLSRMLLQSVGGDQGDSPRPRSGPRPPGSRGSNTVAARAERSRQLERGRLAQIEGEQLEQGLAAALAAANLPRHARPHRRRAARWSR